MEGAELLGEGGEVEGRGVWWWGHSWGWDAAVNRRAWYGCWFGVREGVYAETVLEVGMSELQQFVRARMAVLRGRAVGLSFGGGMS